MKDLLLALSLILLIGIILIASQDPGPRCKSFETVVSIDELHYRDALITLSSGKKVLVNQATLKPGDQRCTEWE